MDKLISALQEVLTTTEAERKAREEYQGYEWGYHGHYLIQAREEAEKAFADAMNAVIDARVRAMCGPNE